MTTNKLPSIEDIYKKYPETAEHLLAMGWRDTHYEREAAIWMRSIAEKILTAERERVKGLIDFLTEECKYENFDLSHDFCQITRQYLKEFENDPNG